MAWIAALVGGAAALGSGVLGASASSGAANTQANAANQATATELGMFNTTQNNLQPYIGAGSNALANLQQLLGIGNGGVGGATSPILTMLGIGPGGASGGGINPATFQGSPGYQYQLQQGENAVTNSAAANGGIGGNALRALQSTGQGVANQNWNQYLGNASTAFQQLIGNVGSVANNGQNAAANLGSTGAAVAGQIGSNQIGAGNALAAGQIGSANAIGGALGGVGQSASLYALLNQLQSGGGGGGGLSGLIGNIQGYGSALGQYVNPYGATGNGMAPIIGDSGLVGGGV